MVRIGIFLEPTKSSDVYTPDGIHIVSGSNDKTVCVYVWDIDNGEEIMHYFLHQDPLCKANHWLKKDPYF